jgi:hypothetical protein
LLGQKKDLKNKDRVANERMISVNWLKKTTLRIFYNKLEKELHD